MAAPAPLGSWSRKAPQTDALEWPKPPHTPEGRTPVSVLCLTQVVLSVSVWPLSTHLSEHKVHKELLDEASGRESVVVRCKDEADL